jgi:hypothetical protein
MDAPKNIGRKFDVSQSVVFPAHRALRVMRLARLHPA